MAQWHFRRDGYRYDVGWRDIINHAEVTTVQRVKQPIAVIWEWGTVTLGASQSRSWRVTADGVPFVDAVDPVAGTDYTLAAGAVSSLTLDRTSGASATLTLTAGAGGCVLTGLQVRGCLLEQSAVTRFVDEDATSQTTYGKRSFTVSIPHLPDAQAEALAQWLVHHWKDPVSRVTVPLTISATNQTLMGLELSDLVKVDETESSLSKNYLIEQIRHRVTQAGKSHVMTLVGSEAVESLSTTLILNDATNGKLNTGTLGY